MSTRFCTDTSQSGDLTDTVPLGSKIILIRSLDSKSLPAKETGQVNNRAKLHLHRNLPSWLQISKSDVMSCDVGIPLIPTERPCVIALLAKALLFKELVVAPVSVRSAMSTPSITRFIVGKACQVPE